VVSRILFALFGARAAVWIVAAGCSAPPITIPTPFDSGPPASSADGASFDASVDSST